MAPGKNSIQLGIAAVSGRLADGTLRVMEGSCPDLLAEACLYRYPEQGEGGSENPLDEHNHALAALRYLVSKIDERRMGRRRPTQKLTAEAEADQRAAGARAAEQKLREQQRRYLMMHPGCWAQWGSS